MPLNADVIPTSKLSEELHQDMFDLMQTYYGNTKRDEFENDLCKKNYVLRIYDENKLVGFSTIEVFEYTWNGKPIKVIFSGDTVMEKSYRVSPLLAMTWGRWMLNLHKESEVAIYWLLISKSFRTYRFLPQNFLEYYPKPQKSSKQLKKLCEALATHKFPEQYNKTLGVVQAKNGGQYLNHNEHPALASQYTDDHKFYLNHNPGYTKGDELVCLLPFYPENFKPLVYRYLVKRDSLKCETHV